MIKLIDYVIFVLLLIMVHGQRRPIAKYPPDKDFVSWISNGGDQITEYEGNDEMHKKIRTQDLDIPIDGRFPSSEVLSKLPTWRASKGYLHLHGQQNKVVDYGENIEEVPWSWWSGPNVCIEQEESTEYDVPKYNYKRNQRPFIDDDENLHWRETRETNFPKNIFLTQSEGYCSEIWNRYECETKTRSRGILKRYTTIYKCCNNYKRTHKTRGCRKVEIKSIIESLRDVEAIEFTNLIITERVTHKLRYNNTIFIPHDRAMMRFVERLTDVTSVVADPFAEKGRLKLNYRKKRSMSTALSTKDLVLNHIVPSSLDIEAIQNNDIVPTYLDGSTIRMNIFPTSSGKRLITANCVPVRQTSVTAVNGFIYMVDGVIPPGSSHILDIVTRSKKLKIFRKILRSKNMAHLLDRKEPYTLLLPTDKAFENLNEFTMQQLLTKSKCGLSILRNLIIPKVVCTSSIKGFLRARSLEGHVYRIERVENNKLYIDGKYEIVKPDVIGSNGVILVLDVLILPDKGLSVTQIMEKYNLTLFREILRSFPDLEAKWNQMTNKTFFLPSDKAFDTSVTDFLERKADNSAYYTLINFYISPGLLNSSEFINNQIIETDLAEISRINLYSNVPLFNQSKITINTITWNCAPISIIDIKCCEAMVHAIDKIILPPTRTIYRIILSDPKFTILRKIIKGTIVQDILSNESNSLTLLAPPDEVLEELNNKDISTLIYDKEKATEVLLNHILKDVVCCSAVTSFRWDFNNYIQSYSGQPKEIGRNSIHQIRIGSSTVTSCDNMATNGVIHHVNNILMPKKRFQITDIGLYDFNV